MGGRSKMQDANADLYRELIRLGHRARIKRAIKHKIMRRVSPQYRRDQFNPPLQSAQAIKSKLNRILQFCDYAKISPKKFWEIAENTRCSEAFHTYGNNPAEYYESWGIKDTLLNVYYQSFLYQEAVAYIYNHFNRARIRYCDYGCGSATNSLYLYDLMDFECVHLYDVENASSSYLKHVIRESHWTNIQWFDVGDEKNRVQKSNYYDVVICCDVLEHLTNPSEILKRVTGMLRPRGYLVLLAPFEYTELPEHIAEAPFDFLKNGGGGGGGGG